MIMGISKLTLAWLFFAVGLSGLATAAELDTRGLTTCGTATAVKALDGARFITPEGQTIKLALVKAPELWELGSKYQSWPYAFEARAALMATISAEELTLFCEGPRLNHEGELVAHVLRADGSWLQHELVLSGRVLVFPRPTRRTGLPDLYKAEQIARDQKAGLWAFNNLVPVEATGPKLHPGWFQIVSGTVRAAEKVGPTIYLNFGEDWHTDFTVEIPASAQTHFDKAGIDPLGYKDQQIEVRGWIDFKSGPRLLIQGPGQILVKSPAPIPAAEKIEGAAPAAP